MVSACGVTADAWLDEGKRSMADYDELVVLIHIPMTPDPSVPEGDFRFPWIDDVERYITDAEDEGEIEPYDPGEELEGEYVFSITGSDEAGLIAFASKIADLTGVPAGAFAVVHDPDAELGDSGEPSRIDLPA